MRNKTGAMWVALAVVSVAAFLSTASCRRAPALSKVKVLIASQNQEDRAKGLLLLERHYFRKGMTLSELETLVAPLPVIYDMQPGKYWIPAAERNTPEGVKCVFVYYQDGRLASWE